MKTIGMIGGTSWVSTVDYYRLLNEGVNRALGGNHSAKIILHSVDFGEVIKLNMEGNREAVYAILKNAAQQIEAAGAGFLMLCANTMHLNADQLQQEISIPILHIADETGMKIQQQGLDKVALLGTKITMESEFYHQRLQRFGISTIVPDEEDRQFIQRTIFEELGRNIFLPETKKRYLEIIGKMADAGARGVILGCTEIPLLLKAGEITIPSFDTLSIHAEAAVREALR